MWVLALAVSILSAALCLRYFARRGERLYVLVVVGTSWSIGFFMFLVLPFDLEHAYCRRCRYTSAHAAAPRGNETANDVIAWEDQPSHCHCLPHPGIEALPTLIPAAYRVTMLLGYLMNDLLRSYISSGEFTSRGRLRDALRECAFFYVPFTVVGVGFLVYLISRQGLTLTAVRMLVTGLFNAIGLFILVAFLGYGLVEVSRQLRHLTLTHTLPLPLPLPLPLGAPPAVAPRGRHRPAALPALQGEGEPRGNPGDCRDTAEASGRCRFLQLEVAAGGLISRVYLSRVSRVYPSGGSRVYLP